MLKLQAETIAAPANRLYVFGVVFSALFLLGFLFMAIVLADSGVSSDGGRSLTEQDFKTRDSALLPSRAPNDVAEPKDNSAAIGSGDPLAAQRRAAIEQLRSAGQNVQQARERLRAAELVLFGYIYSQLNDVIAPSRSDIPTTTATAAAVSVTPPQDPKEVLNPQVADLERQMADAQANKTKLLERLMPSHPLVQNLESTIADLQSRLEKARQTKIIEPAPGVLQLPPVEVRGEGNAASSLTVLAKAHDLMLAAGRAQRDYDAAVEKESSSWSAYYKLPDVLVLGSTPGSPNNAQPASPAVADAKPNARRTGFALRPQTSPTDVSLGRSAVGLIALLALASIGALIAASNAKPRQPTFATVDEIETRLGIPVFGRLAWAGAGTAAIARSLVEPVWVRRSVLAGEIALGLAIGAFALLAIADFEAVRHLAADPLTGIVQAIAKLHG